MERKSTLKSPMIVPLVVARIDPPAHAERLVIAMRQNAAAASEAVAEWRAWHHERGSAALIRKQEQCGACFPPQLSKQMYARATAAAPDVSALTIANTLKWLRRTTTEKKSSKYTVKMWRAILAGWENQPCFTHLPLRIYCQNARLENAPRTETHKYQHIDIIVKVLRGEAGLEETTLRIEHPRKGASEEYHRWFNLLVQMARGKRKFSESQIVWGRGGFGLRLTVEREITKHQLDPAKVLFLRAGNKSAWRARYNGRSISIETEKLPAVRAAREKHIDLRSSGIHTRHWSRFCWTFNRQTVAGLRATILARGIGRVVIFDGRPRCALACVGAEDEREPTNFPMAAFRELLKKSLDDYGCDVVGRANFKSVKRRKARLREKLGGKQVRTSAV